MVSVSILAMILVHQHLNYYPGLSCSKASSKKGNEGTLQIFLGVYRKTQRCLFKNCMSDKEKVWGRLELGIRGGKKQMGEVLKTQSDCSDCCKKKAKLGKVKSREVCQPTQRDGEMQGRTLLAKGQGKYCCKFG